MAQAIYTQTIIAMVWDFDRTLIRGYSQEPIFGEYGIDPGQFWDEVNQLTALYAERNLKVAQDTAYLLHMLTYVREGKLAGLTNGKLRELGSRIPMCPGIPEYLDHTHGVVAGDERFVKNEITVEHYVISTGIRQLIEGSPVGELVKQVWANEFIDQTPPSGYIREGHTFSEEEGEIAQVGYMIDNTSKTRAIFEINKGPEVDVNARIAEEDRRIPIRNMIYICDGPSDVPVCSVVGVNGGRRLGVYQKEAPSNYEGVKQLEDDARVDSIAPADFSEGTPACLWLDSELRKIADTICSSRERLFQRVKPPAGHVS